MRCPACGFENMRGTERCVSCRARLMLADRPAPVPAAPPRAGSLKPLRQLHYALAAGVNRFSRGFRKIATGSFCERFLGNDDLPGDMMATVILSVIPGLGHLATLRVLAALWWGGGWLVLAALVVNLYADDRFYYLPGLLLSWHVSAMVNAAQVAKRLAGVMVQLRTVMVNIFLPCFLGYALLYGLVIWSVDIIAMPFSVPAKTVWADDRVWLRRISPGEKISRGDLVVLAPHEREVSVRVGTYGRNLKLGGRMPAMILALPGDLLETRGLEIKVNGTPVSSSLSLGQILSQERLELVLKKDQVLAIYPAVSRSQMEREGSSAIELFLFQVDEVAFRPQGVWQPFNRRHRLPAAEETVPMAQQK